MNWTWLGRQVLPEEVERTVRREYPDEEWREGWPYRRKNRGLYYYFLGRSSKAPVIIREDGRVVSEEEQARYRILSRGGESWSFLSIVRFIVAGVLGFFLSMVWLGLLAGIMGNAFENEIESEMSDGVAVVGLIHTLFLIPIIQHFLRPRHWNWLEIARKRWLFGVCLIVLFALTPLMVLAADSYTTYTKEEVIHSRFWGLGDRERVPWNDVERVFLSTKWSADELYLVFETELADGEKLLWETSFAEDGETFLQLHDAAAEKGVPMTVDWLQDEDLYYVNQSFGDEVRQFFYETAQYFEKEYPEEAEKRKENG
ncbi:hypothetical protein [Paludifilum halophilum]|uniref:Uncharacterized protein n=1 Tax=Paludifilum halophilum TaxID=1642702 RepID=A0A235B842_9BACL|nr:hypothetical protein [Paludifilum halophilum]OYD08480.1 hypothetical protein CHM34_06530 [Paludifilum halophilum]